MKTSDKIKLDPRLRQLGGRGVARAQVFIEVANRAAGEWLKRQPGVRQLVHVVDGYYTALVEVRRLRELAAGEGVIELERVRFFRPGFARPGRRGRAQPAPRGAPPHGKGAVIGIVDYGLDVSLKDFRDARGKTRVAAIWDHDLSPARGERAPRKYRYGVEYSARQIDSKRGTRHDPFNADPNVSGHGTHVAGIAAAVAPAATLVFVSLRRREVLDHVGTLGGTMANSIKLAHGIAWCFEKADELGLPCVVNLSLGFNGGGHDGNMAVECIIDALLRKPGRAVVVAAGNEDRERGYTRGSLRRGERAEFEWQMGGKGGDDPTPNELELWYDAEAALAVALVAPDGQRSPRVLPGGYDRFSFKGGEALVIDSDAHTPWKGAARIHLELSAGERPAIRKGTWRIEVQAVRAAPGKSVRFDAWIERSLVTEHTQHERSRFAARNVERRTAITLTTPGTAERAITVASHASARRAPPSSFSGRGPTRDGRLKPEVSAPGENILSSNAGGVPARVRKSGTSQATPHVAGVIARMFTRNAYLTAEEIREILVRSARPSGGGWNSKAGYGRVDAARAVALLDELHGSRTGSSGKARMSSSS